MREYRFKNATIYVYGNVNRERLKDATIQLVKSSRKYKLHKQEVKKRWLQ